MIRAFDIRHSGVEMLKLSEHCSRLNAGRGP